MLEKSVLKALPPICAVLFFIMLAALAWTPALAGTTGSLWGNVTDAQTHAALAGAQVTAASPSQTARTTANAAGEFVFLSLLPDTYAITVSKDGYESNQLIGLSIFADQAQNISFALQQSTVKTLGKVSVRSALSLVRPGTVTDVYSVNPALSSAAAPLGGGGSLNQAYSAIASMPGAFVPTGQLGVNQTVYIRGGYYDQIGYEYDGVPVNRSFDNYPGHSAATFGQQELQIYTGGGSANSNATGLAGFINQVVKTGSYPGYGNIDARIGTPTFYHDASVEVGGATPDGLFSYYLGLSGYNPSFRYLDQQNGASLIDQFPEATGPTNVTTFLSFYPAVYPTCNVDGTYSNPAIAFASADPGCYASLPPVYSFYSYLAGRESLANFHFGLPHRYDSGRDDIQLLYTSSAEYRQYYSGVNDAGAPFIAGLVNQGFINPPHWPDFFTFPSGTNFLAPATVPPIAYLFPGSPGNRCANTDPRVPVPGACPSGVVSPLPSDYRDARWDDASIVKLQYQRNFSDKAYLRVFGYTFYSNTNRSGASRRGIGSGFGAANFDYEVDAHTHGFQIQFADQVSDSNQILASVGYVTAATLRANNLNNFNTRNAQVSNLTDGTNCYAFQSGTADNGVDTLTAGGLAPCNDSNSEGTFRFPTEAQGQNPCITGDIPAGSPACLAGATWRLTYTGNQGGRNSLVPTFTNFALIDEWRPNPKLDLNFSVRISNDQFSLSSTDTPGKNFWFGAAQKEFCYNPVTLQPLLVPQPPQSLSTVTPYVTYNCPIDPSDGIQTVHPDGLNGHLLLSNQYGKTYTQTYAEPRFGLTYAVNPDTVLRLSAGRYSQSPQNYEVQYDSFEENLAAQLIGFLPFGFNTPRHDALAQFSNNYDASIEHRFAGSDVTVKFTPYYRWATQQLIAGNVPTIALSPYFNSGTQRTSGVEFALSKGDFRQNGVSGVFSYTYTNSKEWWSNYPNSTINPVDPYNQDIQNFNKLTQAGGGARCYANSADSTPDPTCAATSILNPYYTMAPQPLLDKFAWYDTGLDAPYVSPNVFSLVASYRHDKFAITPALMLNQGASYGTPADVLGVDPRVCFANNSAIPSSGGNPLRADYTSCSFAPSSSGSSLGSLFIPNPVTGRFDTFGEFQQPWQFNMGVQLSYDLSPKVSANLTVANLVNSCFGGSSEPWTKQYPPSRVVCGYAASTFYISNFYNGASPNDIVANGVPLNPYFMQPFVPAYGDVNSFNLPMPMELYFQVHIKI